MKSIRNYFLLSLASAFIAVGVYKLIERPQIVQEQEHQRAFYAKYSDKILSGKLQRKFLSTSPTNFTTAADAVTPTVVNIKSIQSGSVDNWFGQSFTTSTGSGVIITPDGFILTNNHVIEDGNDYEITLSDQREFSATLVGVDESTDLALLKINAKRLPHIIFGNSDSLKVGEWVLAVGNPFNLASTVTAGIVSAKGRNINILEDQYSIESFIQTDAAVNPGNSGGALVNTNGELVGINTAIITQSGRYEGYSFAIPANLARKVINDIKDYGVVQRGMLGIGIAPVTDELSKELDLKTNNGVYINRITPKGGADDAGLKPGDVIVKLNGVPIKAMPELQELVGRYRPGDVLKIDFIRKHKTQQAKVILKNKNNTTSIVENNLEAENYLANLGFEVRELTRKEKQYASQGGVKVKSVYKGSKIERTNMDPGFIITKINDKPVKSIEDLYQILKKEEGKIILEGVYEEFTSEYYYAFRK